MTNNDLLTDVNLSEVAFGSNGQGLSLTFLSMQNGQEVASLRCIGLLVVKYHSMASPLPLYIGEVTHEKLDAENAIIRLNRLGYRFANLDGTTHLPNSEGFHFVHIEGGEIDIVIACSLIEFQRSH